MTAIIIPVLMPQQLTVYFWGQERTGVIPENCPVKQKLNVCVCVMTIFVTVNVNIKHHLPSTKLEQNVSMASMPYF